MSEADALSGNPLETIPQTILRICTSLMGKPVSKDTLYTGVPIIDCEQQLQREANARIYHREITDDMLYLSIIEQTGGGRMCIGIIQGPTVDCTNQVQPAA